MSGICLTLVGRVNADEDVLGVSRDFVGDLLHVGDCDCSRSIAPSLITRSAPGNENSASISLKRLNPVPLPCSSQNSLIYVTLRL